MVDPYEGLEERGQSEDVAEEIAARTVNKERARAGESKQMSKRQLERAVGRWSRPVSRALGGAPGRLSG